MVSNKLVCIHFNSRMQDYIYTCSITYIHALLHQNKKGKKRGEFKGSPPDHAYMHNYMSCACIKDTNLSICTHTFNQYVCKYIQYPCKHIVVHICCNLKNRKIAGPKLCDLLKTGQTLHAVPPPPPFRVAILSIQA